MNGAQASLQELIVLLGEQGAGISLHCCCSGHLDRRRSHQKGCNRGFGSALVLQHRDKMQMLLVKEALACPTAQGPAVSVCAPC